METEQESKQPLQTEVVRETEPLHALSQFGKFVNRYLAKVETLENMYNRNVIIVVIQNILLLKATLNKYMTKIEDILQYVYILPICLAYIKYKIYIEMVQFHHVQQILLLWFM